MSRRGQNEGSIYRRKDGRWSSTVSLGYRNGKRWRKTYYGKTRKEVQVKLAKAVSATQMGMPLVPEHQTVMNGTRSRVLRAAPAPKTIGGKRSKRDASHARVHRRTFSCTC